MLRNMQRGRTPRQCRTIGAGSALALAILCNVTFLGPPSESRAQTIADKPVGKASEQAVTRALDRIRAFKADYTEDVTLGDLDLFIDRFRLVHRQSQPKSVQLQDLSKGTSSLFEDLQLVAGQTFDNSSGYGAPGLVTISENLIGMVYTDLGVSSADFFGPPAVGPRILFRTSADGGASWSDPVVVADDADFILDYLFVGIARTPGGRLVIIDETPFEPNHSFYSDDSGATWTENTGYEETDFADHVFGPVDGKLWVQAGPPPGDQDDVQYIASEDGVTWSAPQVMIPSLPAGASSMEIVDIAQTGASSYLATLQFFVEEPCCELLVGLSRSTDNGATWSAVEVLDMGIPEVNGPRVDAGDDGTVYLSFVGQDDGSEFFNEEIFHAMSTDGGLTFSAPESITRFVGADFHVVQTMVGSDPLIAFRSQRGTRNFATRIWYGMAGENPTPDVDPAPVIDWFNFPPGWVPANKEFPITGVLAIDESGIESVQVSVQQDGEESVVSLSDDGTNGDLEAGDGIFGGMSEAIPYGPNLIISPYGSDNGGNDAYGGFATVSVAALHEVGNFVAAVSPEGAMGYEPLQEFPPSAAGRFPKEGGFNFLPYAGMWVGINKAPGKRVSHLFYDNLFGPTGASPANGDWQVTEYPVETVGESELDVVMRYNDSGGAHPIGLDVKQTTYQWSDASYVIFDYDITNSSGEDLTELYVAMVVDPDMPIGGDFFDDIIGYDADRALIYALDSGNWCSTNDPSLCTDTHLGIALLSDGVEVAGKSAPTPHSVHRWNGFEVGDPTRNQLGLDVDMYDLMTSGIWPGFGLGLKTVASEWRMFLTAQPFDLAAGESRRLVFGLVAGAGEVGIQASTDAMIDRFEKAVLAVTQTDPIPREFALGQNYPNPFNPSTTIAFSTEATSQVRLTVFDVLGRQVDQIVHETLSAGSYTATFESQSLPSGAYYYTLTADGRSITKSMFLLK